MGQTFPIISSRTIFCFLLVFLFLKPTAQQICNRVTLDIEENNAPGAVVGIIPTSGGVTINITDANSPFSINGDQLIADETLDYETGVFHIVSIECSHEDIVISTKVIVNVLNVNDEPPVFEQSQYTINVPEFSPVGTSVCAFSAKDLDNSVLYYTLEPDTEGFQLQAISSPNILVAGHLDYDKVKSVKLTLTARDTATALPPDAPSFTGTTTIMVTIMDIDNRPPWFQPCTLTVVDTASICIDSGYTGSVNLTEQVVGAMSLEPGPVYAIDGDAGINAEIAYTFLSGNEAGVFEINGQTGNITMLKVADVPGPILLRVLATQIGNSNMFASTTVTIKIVLKSLNLPRFEKTQYEGIVSEVGSIVMVANDTSTPTPLMVEAKDADFAEGLNPDVIYELQGSSDFTYFKGLLLLTRDLPLGTVSLQLKAVDSSNGESSTTAVIVEVTSGLPTTSVALSTTEMVSTTMALTSDTTQVTSDTTQVTSETILPTTNASPTTPDDLTTDKPTEGVPVLSGGYSPEDMAALGASLAVLLIICLIAIGFLAVHVKKGKAAWRKLSEASIFRSSLGRGPGGAKEGIQYTNEGFQSDGDTGSGGFKEADVTDMKMGSFSRLGTQPGESPLEVIARSSAPLHALLPDNSSLSGSDKADSEKEVKPILTKERRVEEGYKSVWFKEDIDPNAKEEVVIIPDNEERDIDEDDEDEEEDNSPSPTPNADRNGRLRVKINNEDSDDSEDDEVLTVDL